MAPSGGVFLLLQKCIRLMRCVCFNMVYCSSTIHVPHTVQQNRHHRYRKNLHILMCVQQTDRRRRLTDLSFCLKKKKKDLQNAMRKCWQSGSVTLCYTHTHTDTSCCFHQAPVRHNSSGGTCSHKEFTVARRSPSSQVDTS